MAVVQVEDQCGLIDEKGNYIVEPKYRMIDDTVSCGLIAFADEDGKLGYINTAGKEIAPAQFERSYLYDYYYTPDFYDDGYAVVYLNGRYGVMDTKGNFVIEPKFRNEAFIPCGSVPAT